MGIAQFVPQFAVWCSVGLGLPDGPKLNLSKTLYKIEDVSIYASNIIYKLQTHVSCGNEINIVTSHDNSDR